MGKDAPDSPDLDAPWRAGQAHLRAGRWEEAAACFQRITDVDHGHGPAMAAWGRALRGGGRKREAVAVLRQALKLRPGDAQLACELGDAWQDLGHPREALPVYAEAARADPRLAQAWYGAGCAHLACGEFARATECQREALRREPGWHAARHNLGSALFKLGQVDDALDAFRAATRGPNPKMSLGMIALVIPGSPRAGNREILEARRRWAKGLRADHGKVLADRRGVPGSPPPAFAQGGLEPQPTNKLRVGYVSSFFEKDNWMKPVWSLINRHDRRRFEVHLFSDAPASAIKHGYAGHPQDRFHDISALSNDAAAAEMARAQLGLLIDLNGYSAAGRLAIFAQRPAPIVAGWFNLYATTGLPGFDYLIGDAEVIPPAEEKFYTEAIERVPGSYLSFEVNYPVPEIEPSPRTDGESLRFGCLAPQYKITPEVIATWSEILRQTPGTTLLLRNTALGTENNRNFIARCFTGHGVAEDRLRLEGPAEHFEFLKTYGRIDVALDTFPYNGGQTTTEALWQGVPVVTFWGDRWVARTSASILRAGGLGRFVTASVDEYIRLAVELASPAEREELSVLRTAMRASLRASPVCDAPAFAREMERCYRRICGLAEVQDEDTNRP